MATVDFVHPATAGNVTNVNVNVSTGGGNGSSLWSNAVIVFDYVSPTNYKFAGVFEIIDRLIIGQVVNGKVSYLQQRTFPALAQHVDSAQPRHQPGDKAGDAHIGCDDVQPHVRDAGYGDGGCGHDQRERAI